MPRRIFTQDDYNTLVSAFRKVPGNISGASRLAGVAPKTARRGWNEGWPERHQKPIRVVLEEEAAEVRKRLEEAAERERKLEERERALRPLVDGERERLGAIARREEWSKACAASRHNAQAMLVSIGKLLNTALAKVGSLREDLLKQELSPLQWVRLTRDLITSGRQVAEALHLTLQTEHLALGQPTDIVGLAPMAMTLDEAQKEIAAAQNALDRARARKALPPEAVEILDAEFRESASASPAPLAESLDEASAPSPEGESDAKEKKPNPSDASEAPEIARELDEPATPREGASAQELPAETPRAPGAAPLATPPEPLSPSTGDAPRDSLDDEDLDDAASL
jgi:hypothetical protein